MDIKLNGQTTRAMVDTGATHNFLVDQETKRLGLILEKNPSRMKVVNSEAKRISRLAKGVPIKIETWNGSINMMAVPLDDFQLEPLDGEVIHEPAISTNILKKFTNVMPPELSKTLPPRRVVDHHIELKPRVKPPIYGAFEFLVMPFDLTNAPATFCTLMNQLFNEYLDKFVIVHLNNIVVYSQTLEEHIEHLQTTFKVLRENTLFVKKEKCYFAQTKILFLGHRIGDGSIRMDKSKVQAVAE
ncbi:uncharacterized protein LOC135596464 [Musa acuminata AAA Group]|uniref:uncharacterized protein LOC135596464 n=1 Tax=Musa acuminata AAA Group TaxID=214697 RepID=UPI0031DBD5D8